MAQCCSGLWRSYCLSSQTISPTFNYSPLFSLLSLPFSVLLLLHCTLTPSLSPTHSLSRSSTTHFNHNKTSSELHSFISLHPFGWPVHTSKRHSVGRRKVLFPISFCNYIDREFCFIYSWFRQKKWRQRSSDWIVFVNQWHFKSVIHFSFDLCKMGKKKKKKKMFIAKVSQEKMVSDW